MTQLLTDQEGLAAVIESQKWLLRRRMSRHWHRRLKIALDEWVSTGVFSLQTLADALNDSHDQEIRNCYRILGAIGALPATIDDLSYYIDATAGDDYTGDGSQSNPYQSAWFLDLIPQTIRHAVRILITTDLNIDVINTSRFVFEGDGCLTFLGVSAPEVNTTGHVSTAWQPLYGSGYNVSVNPLAPWAHDSLAGWFVQNTTVASPNYNWVAPILQNFTDSISIPTMGQGLNMSILAAETFRVIRPALSIEVTTMVLNHSNPTRWTRNIPGASDRYNRTRVTFANLRIDCDQVGTGNRWNVTALSDVAFCFCTLAGHMYLAGPLNTHNPFDDDFPALTLTNIENLNPAYQSAGDNAPAGVFIYNQAYPTALGNADIQACVTEYFYPCENVRLAFSGVRGLFYCNGVISRNTGERRSGEAFHTICIWMDYDEGNAIFADNCDTGFSYIGWINNPGETAYAGIGVYEQSKIQLRNFGVDNTIPITPSPDYGIVWGDGVGTYCGSLWISDWDPTTYLAGTVNDILFNDGVPTAAAFPAAHAVATEVSGLGAFVKRGSL